MRKITKDIRFVVVAFLSLFVALSAAAVNAAFSTDKMTGKAVPATNILYTSTFYFKSHELILDTDSVPQTDFLVTTSQAAITASKVYGTSIGVELNPFTIKVIGAGRSEIELSARMQSGDIKTIKCSITVNDTERKPFEENNENKEEESKDIESGYSLFCSPGKVLDVLTDITFSLWKDNSEIFEFVLCAEVIQGDVHLGIIGKVLKINYLSEDMDFIIKVIAVFNDTIVVSQDIQNCL